MKLLTPQLLYTLVFALGVGIIFFTLSLKIKKGTTQSKQSLASFLDAQQEANFITKKELPSSLLFQPTLDLLPQVSDPVCMTCYNTLHQLAKFPMANLQGYDNLTLKKEFGVNHLETLCDYEQHYIHFLKALTTYGMTLNEKDFIKESISTLEYCVQIGCNLNNCYLYLIRNYGIMKDKNSLEDLKEYLKVQPPLGKEVISMQLDATLQSIKNQ
ncbi:MAG: hypothetical protein ACRCW2_02050 [Cellulosilyticaceae bacterium]